MNGGLGMCIFSQLLFLYIFISGVLLELNPWYAVVVYISIAVLSLIIGIDLIRKTIYRFFDSSNLYDAHDGSVYFKCKNWF
ncbi:alpha/beta hydrolase [Bacillus sp. Brlt_9]|uniref:alpha/beta hydrolase n=1 Tax=Bacillus sp. Brlt_9 TaxID=3110916 RepID=UPI003F7B670E